MFKADAYSKSIVPIGIGGCNAGTPLSYRAPSPRDSFHQAATRSEWAVDGYVPKPPPVPPRNSTTPPPTSPAAQAAAQAPLSSAKPETNLFVSLTKTAQALRQMDAKEAISYACRDLPAGGLAREVMTAAVTGDKKMLAQLLARPEVLPDFAGSSGVSPLMAASARGHAEAVEMLASHPLVNLGREAGAGWTALHFATALRHEEAVAALLRHHAPLDALTADGKTAFDMALGSPLENTFRQNSRVRSYLKAMSAVARNKP